MRLLVSCCLLVLVATSCSSIAALQPPTPTPTCLEQSADFINQIEAIATEWDDAEQLAGSTSRIALSPAIANLQEIRRRASALESPQCASLIQTYLTDYMDKTIDGFLLFMADKPESQITAKFKEAIQAFGRYEVEIINIQDK